jgi:hypothetical protein
MSFRMASIAASWKSAVISALKHPSVCAREGQSAELSFFSSLFVRSPHAPFGRVAQHTKYDPADQDVAGQNPNILDQIVSMEVCQK